ncbi:MAG: hypothetical protein BMS9Abin01_1103 [Gammaproteobacteria bacterium]|nr:MAG: hypothetical protein BMS9Abin01_1103 [Gammaproteobacteria bacterium]
MNIQYNALATGSPTGTSAEDSYASRRADALVPMAESLLTNGAASRPDGRVVEPVPGTGSTQSIDGSSIEEINRDCGLDIDADTSVTMWDGTRMDYRMAMDALLARDDALILSSGARYPDHFPRKS